MGGIGSDAPERLPSRERCPIATFRGAGEAQHPAGPGGGGKIVRGVLSAAGRPAPELRQSRALRTSAQVMPSSGAQFRPIWQ